jgi:hypothetical protein
VSGGDADVDAGDAPRRWRCGVEAAPTLASSTKTLSHAVAKLSTSGGGLHVAALRFAQGGLAVPPVIDRNGYRFFVKRHKKDHLVDTVRLEALAPSSLPLGHVGGCF